MSISAISGSSAYTSPYTSSSTSRKKSDDPMSQAISSLRSTDPTLASKLSDMQKQVASMKANGSSDSDIQSAIKSTMDGLSSTEKGEIQSAMPAPPSGGTQGAGGHHHRHASASSGDSDSDASSDDSTSGTTSLFSANSFLNSMGSMQNDSIMSLLSSQSSASMM